MAAALRKFAVSLCGSVPDADDLVQQALLRMLTVRPELAGHMGYARRTVARLWLDRERSLRRRMARLRLMGPRPSGNVVDGVELGEEARRVRQEIDQLPLRQRLAITLRVGEELSYEQIAEVMECDVGTVRANLHLARARLRRRLGGKP